MRQERGMMWQSKSVTHHLGVAGLWRILQGRGFAGLECCCRIRTKQGLKRCVYKGEERNFLFFALKIKIHKWRSNVFVFKLEIVTMIGESQGAGQVTHYLGPQWIKSPRRWVVVAGKNCVCEVRGLSVLVQRLELRGKYTFSRVTRVRVKRS